MAEALLLRTTQIASVSDLLEAFRRGCDAGTMTLTCSLHVAWAVMHMVNVQKEVCKDHRVALRLLSCQKLANVKRYEC